LRTRCGNSLHWNADEEFYDDEIIDCFRNSFTKSLLINNDNDFTIAAEHSEIAC